MKETGRNDLCPCNSGKKYKHCCQPKGGMSATPQAGNLSIQGALQAAVTHYQAGRAPQSEALCRQILQAEPGQADALHLLGLLARDFGKTGLAMELVGKAIAARPLFPEAYYHLGLICMEQGRLEEATAHYRHAVSVAPGFLEAHCNLGALLNRQGQPQQALASYLAAIQIRDILEVKIGLAECFQRLSLSHEMSGVRPLLTRAIAEAWRRPEDLAGAAIALIKTHPGMQAGLARMNRAWPSRLSGQELRGTDGFAASLGDELLLRLLENATVCDAELERWLTTLRANLLDAVLREGAPDDQPLAFYSALARQCFINEYVFACSAAELSQIDQLKARLLAALDPGATIPALALMAVACYLPLNALPGAQALLSHPWPEPVRAVLLQQIEEPLQEELLRAGIPRLTTFDDEVSRQVQQQYEENPYPRWVRPSLFIQPVSLDERLHKLFPRSTFERLGERDPLDVLIAGCGTGQHSTETARRYRHAQVLAIDLSSKSLAYAKRKTRDIGLTSIDYAQADIMQLGALGKSFDLIESVGVLHHLADPVAGWRILLSLLRPRGFMLLGFYSELARGPVVAARRVIAQQGYASTAQDIRRCRQDLMAPDSAAELKPLATFRDFYGLSECRDLLFHVQEHRYTLPALKAILEELKLDFLGFNAEPATLNHYRARFPEDALATDLDNWHQYETANPQAFVGMYQFWVQKR